MANTSTCYSTDFGSDLFNSRWYNFSSISKFFRVTCSKLNNQWTITYKYRLKWLIYRYMYFWLKITHNKIILRLKLMLNKRDIGIIVQHCWRCSINKSRNLFVVISVTIRFDAISAQLGHKGPYKQWLPIHQVAHLQCNLLMIMSFNVILFHYITVSHKDWELFKSLIIIWLQSRLSNLDWHLHWLHFAMIKLGTKIVQKGRCHCLGGISSCILDNP